MNLNLGSSNVSASIGLLKSRFIDQAMRCLDKRGKVYVQALAPGSMLRIRICGDGEGGYQTHTIERVIGVGGLGEEVVVLDLFCTLLK